MLSGLSGRLLDMSARFPQLNYLIQKIAMRKRRDTGKIENKFTRFSLEKIHLSCVFLIWKKVIMGAVISILLILIILYKFS